MQIHVRYTRWLWIILLLGLGLRIAYALSQPTVDLFYGVDGGDSSWYLANGWGFFSGREHGWIRNVPFYLSELPTAPFYILYAGIFQKVLPEHETILVMRLIQSVVGISTAYLAFRLATILRQDARAGLIASVFIAWNPAFIIESSHIATETFYIFFVTLGLWLYIEYVVNTDTHHMRRWVILTALAFGMGTLTRAVLLLFPLGIFIHMLILGFRHHIGLWFKRGLLLLLVYTLLASTWTIYNLGMWNRVVIGSTQLMPALWRGAVENDGTPQENDALLIENPEDVRPEGCEVDCKYQTDTATYIEQINESVGGSIGVFISRRIKELSASYLQPYGTTSLGDTSVREGLVNWLQHERSLSGLIQLLQIEGFTLKLVVWLFHYVGTTLGFVGIGLSFASWRTTLPLLGFIVYTTLIHFVLLALPRYIFPVDVPLAIFAAYAITMLIDRLRHASPITESKQT